MNIQHPIDGSMLTAEMELRDPSDPVAARSERLVRLRIQWHLLIRRKVGQNIGLRQRHRRLIHLPAERAIEAQWGRRGINVPAYSHRVGQ